MEHNIFVPGYGEKKHKKNQIIIIGAGYIGRQALQYFKQDRVKYFADNSSSKIGTSIARVPIIAISDLPGLEKEYDIVIASTKYLQELVEQLRELGITEVYRFISGLRYELEEILAPYLRKKIALFGTGEQANEVWAAIGEEFISYVIDDPKRGTQGNNWNGQTVKTIEDIKHEVDCVFVVEEFPYNFIGDALLRSVSDRNYRIAHIEEFQFGQNRKLITNNYLIENYDAKNENEFINRNSQKTTLFHGISSYVARVNELAQVPMFSNVEIETMNRCNGVCSFCPANRNSDTRELKYMSEELFRKIILELEEMNYDGKLFMYCNNEPFLDDRIESFVKFAREHLPYTRILISTNGIALTMERYKAVIPYVNDFRLNNYNDGLQLIPSAIKLQEYCLGNLEAMKKTHIVMRKANEILSTRGGDAPNRLEKKSYKGETCGEPYRTIIIRPTGEVSLCLSDVKGKYTLGDVSQESMKTIWHGTKFQEIREKLKTGREKIAQCEYCDWVSIF